GVRPHGRRRSGGRLASYAGPLAGGVCTASVPLDLPGSVDPGRLLWHYPRAHRGAGAAFTDSPRSVSPGAEDLRMTWLALAVLMCAPAGESMTATLVEGSVIVAGAPIVTGAVLQPGDTVETQAGGRAAIALPGGSLLRIGRDAPPPRSAIPAGNGC